MTTVSTITTFTLPAGQVAIFEQGGKGTANVDPTGRANVYTIGEQEAFLGPYSKAVSIVVTPSSPVSYRFDTDRDMSDQVGSLKEAIRLTDDGLQIGGAAPNAEQQAAVRAGIGAFPTVSIEELGCVLGGVVNATDVQSAIDSAISAGSDIYIPKGEFTINGGLSINSESSVRIFGSGMDTSILKFQSLGTDPAISADVLQNLQLSNFRITSTDGSGSAGVRFQHDGSTTSVRHKFENLHISNFIAGTGFVANNLELSKFSQIYIYGCLDGFLGNNTGNTSGGSASCVSNVIDQIRVLFCKRKGVELANWGTSALTMPQVLQCGVTVAVDGTYSLTAGQTAQLNIMGSCNSITVDHPDIEEYRYDGETQIFTQLTVGVQFSGTNHQLITPNLVGLSFPWKAVSANDFIIMSPRIISCANNGAQDASSLRMVAIIPRQLTASGQATLIGSGGSGYSNSPAAVSTTGVTVTARSPKMTTAQRDALTGVTSGDEIFNTTVGKKQVYTGAAWETITSA